MKMRLVGLAMSLMLAIESGLTAPATLNARSATGMVEIPLKYERSMYFVTNLSLGTPGQELENTVFDTGSSDLVVGKSTFASDMSSTFNDSGEEYPASYGSIEQLNMSECFDTIQGHGWNVPDFLFGYTSGELDSFSGVLGVGYQAIEAFPEYKNLPASLKSQGLTNVEVFSVDGRTSAPSVVFGGIDANAFQAPLVKTLIPFEIGFITTRSYHNVLAVTVNSIELGGSVISDQTLMYTIDSGADVFAVTEPIYENIIACLGSNFTSDDTSYFPQHEIEDSIVSLNVTGFNLSFPLADIIDETIDHHGEAYASLRLTTVDIGHGDYEGTIPNSVLRYTYVVYDLETDHIFLAPLKSAAQSSSLVAISDVNSFPVETKEAPYYSSSYTSVYDVAKEISVTASMSETSAHSASFTTVSPKASSDRNSSVSVSSSNFSSFPSTSLDIDHTKTALKTSEHSTSATRAAVSVSSTQSVGVCHRRPSSSTHQTS